MTLVASLILAREDGYLKILQAYVGRFRFREAIKRQDRAEAMVHLRQLRETFPELDRPFPIAVGKMKEPISYELTALSVVLPQQERILLPFFPTRSIGVKL